MLIYFEHRPRRLNDVQKDIANIAQKVAGMAAEEALVRSLGCHIGRHMRHMGIIWVSCCFPHCPHSPHFPLWSSWGGRIWMPQPLWTRQVVLLVSLLGLLCFCMFLSRRSVKRANWKHWTKGFRRSSVLSRTESEDRTGHDGTAFPKLLFWARHASLHRLSFWLVSHTLDEKGNWSSTGLQTSKIMRCLMLIEIILYRVKNQPQESAKVNQSCDVAVDVVWASNE